MNNRRKTRILSILFLVFLLAASAVSADSPGEKAESTVRLGYFEFGGMFEGAADGARKSGYCYEYMMQTAIYTGWNYEFVYGSYSELYDLLKNGRIDILPYTNYNDQRGQEVLFSDMILAEEEYYIAVKPGSRAVSGEGIEALNGTVLSTLEGADYNDLLLDFIRENDLDISIKYYRDVNETWDALRSGEVDATVFTSNAYSDDRWNIVCSFGKKPTYIAVAKDRPDFLEALNEATSLISKENPAFLGDLYAHYFSDNPMRQILTQDELAWISEHPVLHVGGFTNDAPHLFSVDEETHTATGLTVDVVNGIIDWLNIDATADFRAYSSLAEMEEALDSGEIDVIIPF